QHADLGFTGRRNPPVLQHAQLELLAGAAVGGSGSGAALLTADSAQHSPYALLLLALHIGAALPRPLQSGSSEPRPRLSDVRRALPARRRADILAAWP